MPRTTTTASSQDRAGRIPVATSPWWSSPWWCGLGRWLILMLTDGWTPRILPSFSRAVPGREYKSVQPAKIRISTTTVTWTNPTSGSCKVASPARAPRQRPPATDGWVPNRRTRSDMPSQPCYHAARRNAGRNRACRFGLLSAGRAAVRRIGAWRPSGHGCGNARAARPLHQTGRLEAAPTRTGATHLTSCC